MKPISIPAILALRETPKIGYKTIEKVLSMPDSFEPSNPSDLIEILKKAKERFGRISVPDIQAVTNSWKKAYEIWERSIGVRIRDGDSNFVPLILFKL